MTEKKRFSVEIGEVENGYIVSDRNKFDERGQFVKYLCSNLGEALTRIRLIADISDE